MHRKVGSLVLKQATLEPFLYAKCLGYSFAFSIHISGKIKSSFIQINFYLHGPFHLRQMDKRSVIFKVSMPQYQDLEIQQHFQSQRNMSSEDIANYLIEIGSNERKLQYCRQILAQNCIFTPQAAFCLNSSQPKTTLFKSQLIQLFKFTGLTCTTEEFNLLYGFFQIDGKNYVSLQQFASILFPEGANFQSLNAKNQKQQGKYPLKYSLQKLFSQILQNQMHLERIRTFKLDNQREGSKVAKKKIHIEHLKTFLATHGKYPNNSTLDQILKELLINKGTEKLHKHIGQYVLQFNQKLGAPIKPTSKQIEQKQQTQNQKSNSQVGNTKIIALNVKNPSPFDLKNLNRDFDENLRSQISMKSNINSQPSNIGSVQERIKSLMSTISIKQGSNKQKKFQIQKDQNSNEKEIRQNYKTKKQRQEKHERQLKQMVTAQNIESKASNEKDVKIARNSRCQEYNISRKFSKYRQSKVVSEENSEISFGSASRDIFFCKNNKSLATQHSKQNQVPVSNKNKNEKSKRIDYLKSLVGQGSATKSKKVETYRF